VHGTHGEFEGEDALERYTAAAEAAKQVAEAV
jgi:hypothetical protein